MNPDYKLILDEVKSLLVEERNTNEGRLTALERQVASDSELIGNLVVGNGGAPAPDLTAQDDYRAHARAFFSQIARRQVTDVEIDYDALRAYENAFPQWIRRGDAITGELRNAMSVGSDPDGGFWTPPQMSRAILSRLHESSPMRQVATVTTIDAPSIEFPVDENDATSGGWVGEYDSRAETATPEVGIQTIYLREQYAMPVATQRLLDMSGFDIEGWLTGKIVDKIRRVENTAFVSGAGVDRPRGFLSYKDTATTDGDADRAWGTLQYVATGVSGGFPSVSGSTADDPDPLITLKSKLKPDYLPNARWMMNRATAATVRKLKDGDGRYVWAESLRQGDPDMLLGYPVVLADDMPDVAADSFSIAFGDFSRYQILDHRTGVRILRDNLTTKGKVKFYTIKYTGGDVLGEGWDAIKLLKFGTS